MKSAEFSKNYIVIEKAKATMKQLTPKDPFDFWQCSAKLVDDENELAVAESEDEYNAVDPLEEELVWEETADRNRVGPFEGIFNGLAVSVSIKNLIHQLPVVIIKEDANGFSIM